jgi:hypothetical protein
MDGTIANFESKCVELFGENWKDELESPGWGAFKKYPNIFEMLEPMPDATELYEGCCDIMGNRNQVHILTALPNRAKDTFPDAPRHKIEWARKYIHPGIRVHFGPFAQDKQYHVRHPRDILIDDMVRNIDQWEAVGGIGITHTSAKQSLNLLRDKMSLLTFS